MKIGIIGLGNMGSQIAAVYSERGYTVYGYDVIEEQRINLEREEIITACSSVEELLSNTDIVITSLPSTEILKVVFENEDAGLLSYLKPRHVVFETSTVDPTVSCEIARKVQEIGARMFDAPISGSPNVVRGHRSMIMIGGDKEVYNENSELLHVLTQNVTYIGSNGSAIVMKLAINYVAISSFHIFSEALIFVEKLGERYDLQTESIVDKLLATEINSIALSSRRDHFAGVSEAPVSPMYIVEKDIQTALNAAERAGSHFESSGKMLKIFRGIIDLGIEKNRDAGNYSMLVHYRNENRAWPELERNHNYTEEQLFDFAVASIKLSQLMVFYESVLFAIHVGNVDLDKTINSMLISAVGSPFLRSCQNLFKKDNWTRLLECANGFKEALNNANVFMQAKAYGTQLSFAKHISKIFENIIYTELSENPCCFQDEKTHMLAEIASIINAHGDDNWPERTHAIFCHLGISDFPLEVLHTLRIRGEMVPKAAEHPFTNKIKYLTFLWESFDKLLISDDETFAIPFKRLLASHMFRSCGRNLVVRKGVYLNFPHLLSVGDDVYLDDHVNLDSKGGLTIGDGVYFGKHSSVYTHTHDEAEHELRTYAPVTIGNNVKILPHVMVLGRLDGTEIAEGTVVLANSLVPKSISGIVSGIPARIVDPEMVEEIRSRQTPSEETLTQLFDVPNKNHTFFGQSHARSSDVNFDTMKEQMNVTLNEISEIIADQDDNWPLKICRIFELFGAPNRYSLKMLEGLILPEEFLPECERFPFTHKLRYLTFLWRAFEELPISSALTFAIPFRRNLALQLFERCGDNFTALHNIYFDMPQRIQIGDDTLLTENVRLIARGGLILGDNLGIAEDVCIETSPLSKLTTSNKPSIIIGNGTKIFTAAKIHDVNGTGIEIGEGAIVGGKALVVGDVAEDALVLGVPARKIRDRRKPEVEKTHVWGNVP